MPSTQTGPIEAAGDIGIKVAVCTRQRPIADEQRPERLARSREAIIMLREECDRHGLRLAVENLPRTCLCNRSGEMISLLEGTGAGVVFDTNHSLAEDSVDFLSALIDGGLEIYSLHISITTCRRTAPAPGNGTNNWPGLPHSLSRPAMTTTRTKFRAGLEQEELSYAELADNMRRLAAGKI